MTDTSETKTYQAVQYDQFGGIDVLYITDKSKPLPEPNQVLVRVKAAGINPGEASIREGRLAKQFPSTFPSGQGSDFAGVIEAVGAEVNQFRVGDEVIGFSDNRNSHAQYVTVESDQLTPRPANVSWEAGGGLFVAGTTAYAGVQVLDLKPGEVVVISGAAGGVGSLAVQLAKNKGAVVIGLASVGNHDWLRQRGIIPVAYGNDTEQAIRDALPGKPVAAFFDTVGKGYVELALKLGVPKERINTIIDFEAVGKYGVQSAGSAQAANAAALGELASQLDKGTLQLIIANTYPLTQVKEAYRELETHHTHGKIVLIP